MTVCVSDIEEVKLEAVTKRWSSSKQDARLGLEPMMDGPVDLQLRLANLRAREQVRRPKRSSKKMVLQTLDDWQSHKNIYVLRRKSRPLCLLVVFDTLVF